jgi:hypothetical protein
MIDFGSGPYPSRKNLGTVLTNEGRVANIHAKQVTGLAAQAHPNIQSRVPTFKRSDLPFLHPSNLQLSIFNQPNLPTCKRSNVPTFPRSNAILPTFQSPAFVPQTTNLEKPLITHNRRRKLALKSQESYLFLEKDFLNFFYSKIPGHRATLGLPSPVSRPSPSIRLHFHSSAPNVQTCQRSNVPTSTVPTFRFRIDPPKRNSKKLRRNKC